ncbi:unnamed protein product [Rangifer tarandus platyrhynchus]|uniref:Uncharacterized protein n=1 Tax=Rangifer tarandus platyrhynchus TaxID=3082113 RepID=A0AC59YF73_RANTA
MAGQQALLLFGFLLPGLLFSEAAKILTVSLVGGSHFLLMNQIAQILQDHGHNVTMLLQRGNLFLPGFKEEEKSYKVFNWFLPEDCNEEFNRSFHSFMEKTFVGRCRFEHFLNIMELLGHHCSHLLRRNDVMNSLKNENFDLVIVEMFDYCPFLVAEKLGKPFVVVLPSLLGTVDFGLPSPLSYVPVFYSLLTDQMDHWTALTQNHCWRSFQNGRELRPDGKEFACIAGGPGSISGEGNGHPRIRLFVSHGGMNSIMEAIQHGVPMQIKAETLALKMKQVIEDKRYKAAAEAASIISRSQPLTPAQRLVGWIDHILQTGGAAHLKPHAFQQSWHEQYLLDVLLFLLMVTLGTAWFCGKLLGLVARWLCGARKLKKA